MSIENNLKIIKLIDIYGDLLTTKQLKIMKDYYFENLSLVEIAENLQISRQAVRDSISKSLKILDNYENVVGKIKSNENIITSLNNLLKLSNDEKLTREIEFLIKNLN